MAEVEELIATKIKDILENDVSGTPFKLVEFERVRISTSDFRESELPAAQMWDLFQRTEHQRGYEQVDWGVALELIDKSKSSGVVEQKDMWELRRNVELALWDRPNLEIPEVIHMIKRSSLTDLHLLQPYFIVRIEFDVRFRRPLTGSC